MKISRETPLVIAAAVAVLPMLPVHAQELRWRTPYFPGAVAPASDPVQQMVFSFCDDQLFRITIEYDRARTNGMTDEDMIAALSERYGPSLTPSRPLNASTMAAQSVGEWSTTVAQWGEGDVAVARAAEDESLRLDQREAPAREIARLQHDADETRLAQEKARTTNKAAFRP